MADLVLDAQGTPAAPASGQVVTYPDNVSQLLCYRNNSRVHSLGGQIRNWNTADVVASAADTYLTGSRLDVPQHLLQAGTTFRWRLVMTKTAAGVAAPAWIVRIGTLGTVGDGARLTFTGPAQTAVIDAGMVEIIAVLRNTGVAGVLAGGLSLRHNLAATGFAVLGTPVLQVISAGFDTTVANLIVGLSVNPGAAGVWTHQVVSAEMLNI